MENQHEAPGEHELGLQFEDDDGNVYVGGEALARADAHFARVEQRRCATLRRMPAQARRDYATYLRTGQAVATRAPVSVQRGRGEARPATRRNMRRRARSSSSDDPGGPGEEPPALTFGAWLRQQPIEPHLLPVGQLDNWPERMLAKYKRQIGEPPRETSRQPQLWDEGVAA